MTNSFQIAPQRQIRQVTEEAEQAPEGGQPTAPQLHTKRLGGQTLDFEVGAGQMLSGFNDALLGMTEGQVKSFTITAADAYGEYNPEAVATVSKSNFPSDFDFAVGEPVYGASPTGQPGMAKIKSFAEENVVLDVNHPLAGEDLTFEVELVEIQEA